jgi:hypothetical protein
MIQFFQVLFFISAITLIVINVLQFNRYQEGRKNGNDSHPIKWFPFILTSLVAIGCALNILIRWIQK